MFMSVSSSVSECNVVYVLVVGMLYESVLM